MTIRPEEVRGVVVPTGVRPLLLPNAAVAEIVAYQGIVVEPQEPLWLLGRVNWRGFTVPVISIAAAAPSAPEIGEGERSRLLICYTPNGNTELPYVGIFAPAPPHLERLRVEVLEPDDRPDVNPFVTHSVLFAGEPSWIPDMDAIESQVLAVTSR